MATGIICMYFVEKCNDFSKNALNMDMFKNALLTIVLVVSVISAVRTIENGNITYYDYSNDYYSYEPFTANVIGGEWLPVAIEDKDIIVDNSKIMMGSNGKQIPFNRDKNTIVANIEDDYSYIDVPFIFYKGYAAILSAGGNSTQLITDGNGANGMCRVYNVSKGTLKVYYKGTVIQYISYLISLFTVICIVTVLVIRREKTADLQEAGNE